MSVGIYSATRLASARSLGGFRFDRGRGERAHRERPIGERSRTNRDPEQACPRRPQRSRLDDEESCRHADSATSQANGPTPAMPNRLRNYHGEAEHQSAQRARSAYHRRILRRHPVDAHVGERIMAFADCGGEPNKREASWLVVGVSTPRVAAPPPPPHAGSRSAARARAMTMPAFGWCLSA